MKKAKQLLANGLSMTGRCNRLAFRNVDSVIMAVMLPAILMVCFVYLFGGAMDAAHVGASYVNYVVAGVLILAIGQCAAITSVSINQDMKTGMVDRFLSMPVSRSSFLVGHFMAAVTRNIISTAVVIGVAFAIGFRPTAGFGDWLIIIPLMLLFMFVMTWFSIFFGVFAKSPEGAGAFTMITMLLPYLSSGFVPTNTMPSVLRWISEYQPMTPIIESLRYLFLGTGDNQILLALGWMIGLLIIGYAVSALMFRRRISK